MTAESAPTIHDAQRAAKAIVEAGVRRVLVYGSVARGRAGPHSDIDLVAVDADLDYSSRWKRSSRLENIAYSACGFRTEVFATDEPEWRIRTTEVLSSFEAHIASYAIEIAASSDASGVVDWDKPIGRPHSDTAELADRLEIATNRIIALQLRAHPTRRELELDASDPEHAEFGRRVRHMSILADSYQAIFAAARVMHVATLNIAPPKGDDLAMLLAAQPSWVGDAFQNAVKSSGAALAEMHYWRDLGDEEPDRHTRQIDPRHIGPAHDAAHAIAGWVLDRLDLDSEVLDRHRRRLTGR